MSPRKSSVAVTALAAGLGLALAGCTADDANDGGTASGADDGLVRVGFVAVGPEGGWREANERNIQETFSREAGFDLTYAPAVDLDQLSQFDAFDAFVDEGVDVILLSATEGFGWEDTLRRAQDAEIPVILIDRGIEPEDTSLYVTRIAPDNFVVAQTVGEWAVTAGGDGANYFILEGPPGVGVVNERNRGFDFIVEIYPELVEVGAQTANWSTDEAKEVFAAALAAHDNDIQIVFAQNDEMGLGAALAVEEAGLRPGFDVKIATIDGTRAAMEALAAGRLSFVAEYNPLFGQTALEVVRATLAGDAVEPYIIVESETFRGPEAARAALPRREY